MIKALLVVMVVISFSACGDSTMSTTTDSSGKVVDSTQMILDSTQKVDSIRTNIDTLHSKP